MEETVIYSVWRWMSGCGVSRGFMKVKIQTKMENKKNWKNSERLELVELHEGYWRRLHSLLTAQGCPDKDSSWLKSTPSSVYQQWHLLWCYSYSEGVPSLHFHKNTFCLLHKPCTCAIASFYFTKKAVYIENMWGKKWEKGSVIILRVDHDKNTQFRILIWDI